ncbi:MAG: YifB family Mg chelatase-like AAA ATPase [Oscillospiraceae bacterium]|jgi:magnesium chelatase family protein|nr:YifB family Mg chelatase-like AAA ATPase [Oscillospiraceae bacterium]
MYAKVTSAGLFGLDACPVLVETDISRGLPNFEIVGLPDAAVRESRDRVKAAIKNCGFEVPTGRITVNMAPADLRKVGPIYDLPIFLSLLSAGGQTDVDFIGDLFVGELALDGTIRRIQGVLPMAVMAREQGFKRFFVPAENAAEASIVQGLDVYGVKSALDVMNFLEGLKEMAPHPPLEFSPEAFRETLDMADVQGQAFAKRAMEVAAAGGHNAILIGSPGSGKSMLAKRLPTILPDITFEEAIESTKVHSIAGILDSEHPMVTSRPFRAPHHTISSAGLSGGGSIPRPGEISLAHNGVLFLDELPEFDRQTLEILRQPIEEGHVTIARANGTLTYPCSMILIAAMNPCPCGYYGHPTRPCSCSPQYVTRYLNKVSGPLLDRLDLHIEVAPVEFAQLSSKRKSESSADIRARVNQARAVQLKRFAGTSIRCNAQIPAAMLQEVCVLTQSASKALFQAFERLGLSARGYNRILKVARTIADLAGNEEIDLPHISEAIQYRSLDRKYWGSE